MDLTFSFYEAVFETMVSFTMDATPEHPYMKIIDLGNGGALDLFEVAEEVMIGERRRIGSNGRKRTRQSWPQMDWSGDPVRTLES